MAVPRITCTALHLRVLPSFSPPLQWTRCQTQPSGSTPARSTQLPRSHQACYRLLSLSLRLPTKRRQGGPRTPFTLCSNRQPLQKIRGKTLARRLPQASCGLLHPSCSAGISWDLVAGIHSARTSSSLEGGTDLCERMLL